MRGILVRVFDSIGGFTCLYASREITTQKHRMYLEHASQWADDWPLPWTTWSSPR